MPKEAIISDRIAPPAGPFSPAIRAGGIVYLSGQVAQDPATGRLIEGDVTRRTTVAVAALPLGAAVEIDLVAH